MVLVSPQRSRGSGDRRGADALLAEFRRNREVTLPFGRVYEDLGVVAYEDKSIPFMRKQIHAWRVADYVVDADQQIDACGRRERQRRVHRVSLAMGGIVLHERRMR